MKMRPLIGLIASKKTLTNIMLAIFVIFFASFSAQQYMCRVSLGLEWNTAALAIAKALYIPADK